MNRILLFLLVCAAGVKPGFGQLEDSPESESVSTTQNPLDHSVVTVSSRSGDDIYQTDVETLLPIFVTQDGSGFVFTSLAYNFRDNGNSNFSGGVGFRFDVPQWDAIAGIRAHGDVTEAQAGHQFEQFGLGFDLFTAIGIDVHGNGYFADESARFLGFGDPFAQQHSILQDEFFEQARSGGDIQIAFPVPLLDDVLPTRAFVGGYHYDGDHAVDLSGLMAGIEVSPFSGVSVGAEYYDDEEFYGSSWVFKAGASIPVDNVLNPADWARGIGRLFQGRGERLSDQDAFKRRAYQPVVRRNWIVTENYVAPRTIDSDVVFVNNLTGAVGNPGTFEAPLSSIQAGVNQASAKFGNAGDVVVAGTGTTYTENVVDAGSSLNLWGGGRGFPVNGGRSFTYGSQPVLGGRLNITDTSAFLLSGFTVTSSTSDGIFVQNVSEVDILWNSVFNSTLDGMQFVYNGTNQGNVRIIGNTVMTAGADTVRFDLQGSSVVNLVVDGNQFSNAASDGIEFDLENNTVVTGLIVNNLIRNTTFGEGIEIDQDQSSSATMRILSNRILNTFADPLDIDLDNNSFGRYQVAHNSFSSPQPASIIDIDTNNSATLHAQIFANTSNVNFDFDEDGSSTFLLENTLGTNVLTGGASFVIDPLILPYVPFGTFGFPDP